MKIVRTLCLGLLMLGVGLSVGAEEAARPPGFSGEVGTEAAFLPDLGLEAWVDLYWNLDGLGIGTLNALLNGVWPLWSSFWVSWVTIACFQIRLFGF